MKELLHCASGLKVCGTGASHVLVQVLLIRHLLFYIILGTLLSSAHSLFLNRGQELCLVCLCVPQQC